jgi:hypothetical protein
MFGFSLVSNMLFQQFTIQLINGMSRETNQLMSCGSDSTHYVPIIQLYVSCGRLF